MTLKKPTFKMERKNHQPLKEIHKNYKFLLIHSFMTVQLTRLMQVIIC